MRLPTNSIRWRLQAWYSFLLLVAIAGFCLVTLRLAWNDQAKRLDRVIMEKERMLIETVLRMERHMNVDSFRSKSRESQMEIPPPITTYTLEKLRTHELELPEEVVKNFSGKDEGHYFFILKEPDGGVLFASENAPKSISFPDSKAGTDMDVRRYRDNFRECFKGGPRGLQSCLGKEVTPELQEMRAFTISLSLAAGTFWIIGLWGGWWIAGRAIQPIKTISETADNIARGSLKERIELKGTDSELDQLGQVLNHSFDELEVAMERQKQFTADASHELRTPLTVILSESRRMLKRSRNSEEYQKALQACEESGLRMKSLVQGLLLLARQERKGTADDHELSDLHTMMKDSIREHQPLLEEKMLKLNSELETDVKAVVDPDAMKILFNNLIGNAISHHPGNGKIEVSLQTLDNQVSVEVADDGIGIAKEHLEKIFERFYRIDQSRSGDYEHSGLGLALVKLIAENHGGTCSVTSRVGEGSRFTVTIPFRSS